MSGTPREKILQMLVYHHYVRPHIHFPSLAEAEYRLVTGLRDDLGERMTAQEATACVQRWFDRAWRDAAHEFAQVRLGAECAFYSLEPVQSTQQVSSKQLELLEGL